MTTNLIGEYEYKKSLSSKIPNNVPIEKFNSSFVGVHNGLMEKLVKYLKDMTKILYEKDFDLVDFEEIQAEIDMILSKARIVVLNYLRTKEEYIKNSK